MTRHPRPRHAAPSRTSRIAGRAALGVLGTPVALLAVAGPAGAAEFDGTYSDEDRSASANADGSDTIAAADLLGTGFAGGLPAPGDLGVGALDLQGVDPSVLDIGGGLPALRSADALPALPGTDALPALPGTDALPALPGTDALPALPGTDALPSVDTVSLDSLPSLDALPSADALPGAAALPTVPAAFLSASAEAFLDLI